MSGKLDLASPWARAAFTTIDRADIEGLIPDSVRIVVTVNADRSRYTLRAWRGTALLLEWHDRQSAVVAARYMAERLHGLLLDSGT